MAHNWNNPVNSLSLANYTSAITDGLLSLAKQDLSSDSNIPTNAIQWHSGSDKWQKWNGSSWADLTSKYLIDVDTLDGLHSSAFAVIAHVGAGGVSEHAVATGSVAGFMSAADKTIFDAATAVATANALMKRDASGRAKVAAPSASDDIARKNETDAVQTNLTSHIGDTGAAHGLATGSVHGFLDSSDFTRLSAVEAGAEINQTDSELLTQIKNVDGTGSGLDADTVDGLHATDLLTQTVTNITVPSTSEWLGLPTGVQMYWIAFQVLSLSGTDKWGIRIGTSSTYATSYQGAISNSGGSDAWSSIATMTRGSRSAAESWYGLITVARAGTSNRFSISGTVAYAGGAAHYAAGGLTLGADLAKIEFQTSGSNTFDVGFASLTYIS